MMGIVEFKQNNKIYRREIKNVEHRLNIYNFPEG